MGLEDREVIELSKQLDRELPRLEAFLDRYRAFSGAFLEQEFPGGSDQIYQRIPEKHRELAEKPPRYVDPPDVTAEKLDSLSRDAAYAVNFAGLRSSNIDSAVEVSGGDYRIADVHGSFFRFSDIVEALEEHSVRLEDVENGMIGIARLLDVSEDVSGKPFNRMMDLYQTGGGEDLEAAKRADPDDIEFPVENYWPFENHSGSREKVI